jgi:hypothetical protein
VVRWRDRRGRKRDGTALRRAGESAIRVKRETHPDKKKPRQGQSSLLLCLAGSIGAAEEESGVQAVWKQFLEAWNRHDAHAFFL